MATATQEQTTMLALVLFVQLCVPALAATGHWFSFGDSYTATKFDFNGAQPSLLNPLGNPVFPGTTPCGAVPNWLAWATTTLNSTARLAYNFAYSGATITDALVPPSNASIATVVEQVDEFQTGYTNTSISMTKAVWNASEALFATFIGINDIGLSYATATNQTALDANLIDAYFAQMQRLYSLGARNFLFLNVPPTDRSPLIIGRGADAQAKYAAAVKDFNSRLPLRILDFVLFHLGARVWSVDTNSVVSQLLDDPTSFGFKDATSFGRGDQFIWCNNYHISSAAHKFVAQAVQKALNGTNLL